MSVILTILLLIFLTWIILVFYFLYVYGFFLFIKNYFKYFKQIKLVFRFLSVCYFGWAVRRLIYTILLFVHFRFSGFHSISQRALENVSWNLRDMKRILYLTLFKECFITILKGGPKQTKKIIFGISLYRQRLQIRCYYSI